MNEHKKRYYQKCGFIDAAKQRIKESLYPKVVKADLASVSEIDDILFDLKDIIDMIEEARKLTVPL